MPTAWGIHKREDDECVPASAGVSSKRGNTNKNIGELKM